MIEAQGVDGVLFAVKDHIATKLLPSPANLETLTVEIKLSYTILLYFVWCSYLFPNPTPIA